MKVALIPARSGSKRLPDKNLLPLGQIPLISHAIEAVIQSESFDHIIVSSDDNRILDIAREYTSVTAWLRPAHLASDTATTPHVLLHVLERLKCKEGICGIFLPTSPFRRRQHIVEAMNLTTSDIDFVISITHYSAPIAFRMRFSQDQSAKVELPEDSPLIQGNTRTQEHEEFVHPNGAIYLGKISSFLKVGSFFQGNIAGYLMGKLESLDIDTWEDYQLAQGIFEQMLGNQ